MCDSQAVRQWLLSISKASKTPCDANPPIPSNKRKRRNSQARTPPNSDRNDISSHPEATCFSVEADRQDIGTTMADQDNPFTPTKRPRLVPTESNPDETPRAPVRPDDSVSCDGNKSVASSSRPSCSKSPTNQYAAAEISQNPIKFLSLASIKTIQNIDARPGLRDLRDVYNAISRFENGREIIPASDEVGSLHLPPPFDAASIQIILTRRCGTGGDTRVISYGRIRRKQLLRTDGPTGETIWTCAFLCRGEPHHPGFAVWQRGKIRRSTLGLRSALQNTCSIFAAAPRPCPRWSC